jgi:site-specific DNA-methyltransferase (adenine-specific)
MSSVELFNKDCFEFMATLKDESIDCIISDFPYNSTQNEYDKKPFDIVRAMKELERIAKPKAPILAFCNQPFTTRVINAASHIWRDEIIWSKTAPTGYLDCNTRHLNAHENIQIFSKAGEHTYNPQMGQGKPKGIINRKENSSETYNKDKAHATINNGERFPTSVIHYSNGHGGTKKLHPNEKPLDMYFYLVKTFSNPGDLVFDPTFGSGVCAHACAMLERPFIGCEENKVFYDDATVRLEAVKAQPLLF